MKRKLVSFFVKNLFDNPIAKPKNFRKKFFKNFPIMSVDKFNKKKVKFYIIRVRKSGGGLFSNVLYVLNHIKIAKKNKLLPIVDMQNFYTIYNERNNINKTKNSWEYYFKQISNFTLEKIYNEKKLIFCDPKINLPRNFIEKRNLKRLFESNIKIKKKFFDYPNDFEKKYFTNKKVIGVHLRGTDMKITPNHSMPPTINQIFNILDKLIIKKKFNRIFLVTDQLSYLVEFKKKYKDLVCYTNCFRSNKNKIFNLKIRKNHRYKLGKESLEQMLLLSKMKYLISSRSNLSRCAALFSKKSIQCIEIDNGMNSKKIFYAQFKWYIKKNLPEFLGGFKKDIKIEFKRLSY